ncbi:MAG: TauD/TfdA family dioxygenase [Novosphingobium sp.]|nr:TauD/TfdA family dioxygenase [Novosphingobium sp.]
MTNVETIADIRFEKVAVPAGALVHGVGIDESDPQVAKRLNQALHDHGVLFFDFDHVVTPGEFNSFSRLFGEPEDGYPLSVDNDDAPETPFIDSDIVPMKDVRINVFHTDGTALENPPQAAMLTPFELPEVGGDTMFASMYAAWDDLSSFHQRLLEDVQVQHGTTRLPFLRESPSAVHPAVIRDAVTGRKMLFVNANYTESIIGMSASESESLLQMLFAHINTPEYHVRRPWRLGTIAVWEERVVQHRGLADFTGPRKLRRITFKGDRPSA